MKPNENPGELVRVAIKDGEWVSVTIKNVDVRLGAMAGLMLKLTVASIPALILIGIIAFFVSIVISAIGGSP